MIWLRTMIVCLVMATAMPLLASTAGAGHDLTCHPPTGGGTFDDMIILDDIITTALRLNLGVFIDRAAGEARPVGVALLRAGEGDRRHPLRALALKPMAATAQCADLDGDGQAGITSLVIQLESRRTGDAYALHVAVDGDDLDGTPGRVQTTARLEADERIVATAIVTLDLRGR